MNSIIGYTSTGEEVPYMSREDVEKWCNEFSLEDSGEEVPHMSLEDVEKWCKEFSRVYVKSV